MDIPEGTYSVRSFAASLDAAVRSAFPGQVWVAGVVSGKTKRNGRVYFELVDRPAPQAPPTARLRVVAHPAAVAAIASACREAGIKVDDGVAVRVSGKVVTYAAQGAVQLEMSGIDAAFTVATMVRSREEILAELLAEGAGAAQRRARVPRVALRVALVTSAQSAAFADFTRHLEASGAAFEVVCIDTNVQGPTAAAALTRAVQAAARARGGWVPDVVVVIRGGGARTDLAAFDDATLARAVGACPVPVIVGVGHEIDRSICDELAHLSVKTPTAAAQHLIDQVVAARQATAEAHVRIVASTEHALDRAARRVVDVRNRAVTDADVALRRHHERVTGLVSCCIPAALAGLDRATERVEAARRLADARSPQRLLDIGFAIVRHDGVALHSVADVLTGNTLSVSLADGTFAVTPLAGDGKTTNPSEEPDARI